jgi:hypothetical protein
MTQLTTLEIAAIEREGLDKYSSPYGKTNPQTYAYISGAIAATVREREKAGKLVEALEVSKKAMIDLVRQLPNDEKLADYNLDYCEIAEQKITDALYQYKSI